MINFEEQLPRNKFDFERVHKIKRMEKKDIIPLLPELLEWIQDMNWPIAPKVAEILITFPKEIVPHLKNVFSTNDDIWKFWCLEYLIKKLPPHYKESLRNDLIRLITTPTEGEKLEEVDKKAGAILEEELCFFQ
ncbi:DUF5071 domain-containing protein [Bacillus sp. FJAT-29790]|uniref:DUF5071 domain-containing protein n=1 Tax=Bacillus sp. FJAT-29790 TaxID=1895002 RepID=UPI001C21A439|nr:DUF5071 domain-containing protein [Bacillus sp. FJAT-29790]MBU8878875.1 DUF5071 domain-containing protein [Bacillus sp. FJAT-29790]